MSCTNLPRPTSRARLWALVDCNSFYCSCERLFRPDLADKPVVVLSNNDGCLIALTPEAKALGFKMGDVHFQVEQRLRQLGVAVFSSNYTLYGDISDRVMDTLRSVTPEIDQYSIDEAFVPFTAALAPQAEAVGWTIHDRVRRWVGVPVRVGIGPTRTLAKLANHWAKKISRVLLLEPGEQLEDLLERTATVDIWGIGRRQSAKLEKIGIRNARQLRDMDLDRALKLLTVVGQRTVLELRGFQCIMEDEKPVPRKTLVSTRSFGRKVTRREDLAEALAMHCAIAGERLRLEDMEAGTLSVTMQTSMHTEQRFFHAGASVAMQVPTNVTSELVKAAQRALDKCYEAGHGYMKGGIMLFDLQPAGSRQLTLLEACARPEDERRKKLMQALDQVNDRYGRDTLRYSAQGPAKAFWHMQRNQKSSDLTTRWEGLPVIRTA